MNAKAAMNSRSADEEGVLAPTEPGRAGAGHEEHESAGAHRHEHGCDANGEDDGHGPEQGVHLGSYVGYVGPVGRVISMTVAGGER